MSRKTIQLGNLKPRVLVLAIIAGLIFIHGVTSSVLLRQSNCSNQARILDLATYMVLIGAVIIWPWQKARTVLCRRLHTPWYRWFGITLSLFSGWILLRGVMTSASTRETLVALLFDTALFWVFLLIATFYQPSHDNRPNELPTIMGIIGFLSLVAALLYITGTHDSIDTWLGYGRCGTEAILRTGGTDGWLRSRGFARNPNELGALLIIPFSYYSLQLVGLKRGKDSSRRWVYWSALLALLIFTFSRSAWIGTIVAGIYLVISNQTVRQWVKKYFGAFIAVLAIVTLLAMLNPNSQKRLNELVLHKGIRSDSTAQHLSSKRRGIDYVEHHPFGTGPGSAGAVGAALKDGPSIETENAYLDIAAQYGLIGLAFVLCLLTMMLAQLRRVKTLAGQAVTAGLTGILVSGLTIPVFSNLPVTLLTAILVGLVVGSFASLQSKRSANK